MGDSNTSSDLVIKFAAPVATAAGGWIAAWFNSRRKARELHKEKEELKDQNKELADKVKRLETSQEEAVLVAQGLAVGYYANFIRALSGMLANGTLQVRLDEHDRMQSMGEIESFGKRDVDLFCIIPAQLVRDREKDCFNRLESHHKGAIIRGKNIRDFDINYALSTRDEKRVLQIYDVSKPLFALRSYLKEFRKIDENDPDWLKVTEPAVSTFRLTLERMQNSDEGAKTMKFEFDTVK